MKKLVIDIESSPNLADVWGLFDQSVSLAQLRETQSVICWAAQWVGSDKIEFMSDHHHGHEKMIGRAWELLDEADAVITYNGISYDDKHLRREFVLAGASPPSPFADIDLLRTVRAQFKFASNKLDHVVQQLDLGSKMAHEGHELWVKCLAGDRAAWGRMRDYCKHDVALTGLLYQRLLPWIKNHPHEGLYSGVADCCSRCGASDLRPRGFAYTALSKVQRFRCGGCGAWSKGGRALDRVEARAA